jgi:cell division protein FtsZ
VKNEEIMSTQETETKSIIDNNQPNNYEESFAEEALNHASTQVENNSIEMETLSSNGLENFGVEEESDFGLFNSDNQSTEDQALLSVENNIESSEDDDLEIPAFLRRQKN